MKIKAILIWIFAIVFTLALAIYQRMTGPTYPVRGKVTIDNQVIKYRLIRTYDGADDAKIRVIAPDTAIGGTLTFRRFKSYDKWVTVPMQRNGDTLTGLLPHQEAAGKVMYQITLQKGGNRYLLNDHPAVLRYKGFVPDYVLIPHIFFIFLAMVFSTLTGLMALFKMKNTYIYAWITLILLTIGGMILGPVVQKFSFGAFWTGWPFGHDLTDNKSLIAFIFWIVAVVIMARKRDNRLWPIVASVVLLVVFLIPHSVLGSELDYTQEKVIENPKN